jgi:hypothetical protein
LKKASPFPLLLCLFLAFLAPAWVHAQAASQPAASPPAGNYSANPSTPFNYGNAEKKGLDGIGSSIFNGMMSLFTSFTFNQSAIKILDWVANVFVLVMKYFWTLVGSILIRNIDFTNQASFNNGLGFQTVNNLYILFVTVGVCCTLSFFFLHIGQNAVGLGRTEIRFRSLIRLLVALSVIMIIPYFTSFMALWTNSLSQLIYQQNMMNMNGALDGISNMSAQSFSQTTPVQPSSAPVDTLSFANVHAGLLMILNYSYFFAFIGCVIGMAVGSYKISSASQNGMKIFIGACLGLIFIIVAFELTRYLFANGASIFGGNPGQVSSVRAFNGSTFTVPQPLTSPNLNMDTGGFWSGVQQIFNSTFTQEASVGLELIAVIVKIFISIFGCWIIAKVFFGKIFQLLTLAALFLLSPLLAATIAHPAMEGIAVAGLKYTVKYYLYSVVWAIALVFMFIITTINFGFSNLGVQNFETALAMLGGLIFVEKVEGLVGLLTGTGGPTVEGAMRDFGQFTAAVIGGATAAAGSTMGAIGAAKATMGESFGGHHLAGAVAGGAAGFMAPVLGAGTTSKVAANAGISLAHSLGSYFSGGAPSPAASSNPYDNIGGGSSGNSDLANSLQGLSNSLNSRTMARGPKPNTGRA